MRKKIVDTWWADKFIEALESFTEYNRLGRGRAYFHKGSVFSLNISTNNVRAKVEGHYLPSYNVKINFEKFTEKVWGKIIEHLCSLPVYLALLLNEKMPKDIDEELKKINISLFPEGSKEIDTYCNCPDWENPCKHVSAVYYNLASMFDKDPFLLFELRGMKKQELINQLKIKSRIDLSIFDNKRKRKINLPWYLNDNLFNLGKKEQLPKNITLQKWYKNKKQVSHFSYDKPHITALPLKIIGKPLIRDGYKYVEKNILLYKEVSKYLRGGRL